MKLKPCTFYVEGSPDPLTYDQMRAYLLDNYDSLVSPSVSKSKLSKLADDLDSFADEISGSAGLNAAAVAAAAKALSKILRAADSIVDALNDWRATREYRALEKAERDAVESRASELIGDDYVPPVKEKKTAARPGGKRFRGTIENFVENSDLPEDIKERMRQDPRSYMETLSYEDAKAIVDVMAEAMGGIEALVEDVKKENTKVPLELQSIVLGEGIVNAKNMGEKATSKEDKDDWADIENELHQLMAEKATQAGRYNAYFNKFYERSDYAIIRRQKQLIEQINRTFAPQAESGAKEVNEILNRPEDAEEAIQEAIDRAVGEAIAERDKTIAALEKKIEEFKKAPKQKAVRNKTGRPRRFTEDRLKELRKQFAGELSANPFLDPRRWEYYSYAAGYYLESGYIKFADFFKKMSKETGGRDEEYFALLYEQAKARLIEDGYTEGDFDNAETVERLAEEMMNDARAMREQLEDEKAARKDAKRFQGRGLDKTIREALIEAGYGKEVNGKMQVDWRKVTGESRDAAPIVEKVKKALEGKVPADQIATLIPVIERETNRLIVDKKAKAIQAKVKQYETRRRNRLLTRIKRNTRIQGLLETWKQGGLSNKVILEKLAEDFGIVSFTDQDEAFISDLVAKIDKAPIGAERERLEERLQAYLEYNSHPLFLAKVFHERMKARLLAGFVTFTKNLSGVFDAATDVAYRAALEQIKSGGDKQVFKAIFNAHRKAFYTAMDVLLRGGVDLGTAMSEITGNKEGSPSVRWMENPRSDFENQKIVARGFRRGVTKFERIFMRAMSAADTFNQIMVQEVTAYGLIKASLTEQYPDKSSSEINAMAYEMAFSEELADARRQAAREYEEMGVNIQGVSGKARFERRVHEIVEQAREKYSKNVTRKVQLAGNIATYKAPDPGLFSGAGVILKKGMSGVTTYLSQKKDRAIKEGDSSTAKKVEAAEFVYKTTIDYLIPFVGILGNIQEKAMEFTPYGYAKAAYYGVKAAKDEFSGQNSQAFEQMGYYMFRATMGTLLTALSLALADDDEEDAMARIYGEGPDNWAQGRNLSKTRPENTMVVGGARIPLDLLGSWGMPVKMTGKFLDKKRYDKVEMSLIGELLMTTNSIWFDTPSQLVKNLTSNKEYKKESQFQKIGADVLTRATIPATAFARQLGQAVSPKAQTPVTFQQQLLKYAGLSGMVGMPAYDYRGKQYDTGQIFTSSADGFIKMFRDEIKVDQVDKFILGAHPGVMILPRSNDNTEFWNEEEGVYSDMTNEQYYRVGLNAALKFDALVSPLVKSLGKEVDNPDSWKESDISAGEWERYARTAEEQLTAEGVEVTPDAVFKRQTELYNAERVGKAQRNAIEKMLSAANASALYDFYQKSGRRVPFQLMGAKDEYESLFLTIKAGVNPFAP